MPRRTLLSRTVPLRVEASSPRGTYLERSTGPAPPVGSPAVGGPERIKLWGFLFYTWDPSDPTDFDSIVCSPFEKGYNWAQWYAALSARIAARGGVIGDEIVIAGNYVTLKKEAALDAASMLQVCVLGHSPPWQHVQAIKARSYVGTRVLTGLHNLESCAQSTEWNPVLEPERLVSRAYALTGKATSGCGADGLNCYDCTAIDKYEKRGSCGGYVPPRADATSLCSANACGVGAPPLYAAGAVGCPHTPAHAGLPANADVGGKHTWDCDVRVGAYHAALADAILDSFDTYYTQAGRHVLDGGLFDNHGEDPYDGDATVTFPDAYTTALYRLGWTDWDAHLAAQLLARGAVPDPAWWYWANCTDSTTVYPASQIRNRWNEFFFVLGGVSARPWAGAGGIEEALTRARQEGLRLVLGATGTFAGQAYWMTTSGSSYPVVYGDWAGVYTKVKALGAWDNIYVQAIRCTDGGYACWQEGWEVLR